MLSVMLFALIVIELELTRVGGVVPYKAHNLERLFDSVPATVRRTGGSPPPMVWQNNRYVRLACNAHAVYDAESNRMSAWVASGR